MDDLYNAYFADTIAKITYERFKKLSKKGKPQQNKEWTLLSSIVISHVGGSCGKTRFKVVAMATGTKCMGQSFLSGNGDVVADSHAEVLTRRAFIRYLFHQISLVLRGEKSEIFKSFDPHLCTLKPDVKFHFFISHTPCGDASIFPMSPALISERKESADKMTESKTLKRVTEDTVDEPSKKIKLDEVQCGISDDDSLRTHIQDENKEDDLEVNPLAHNSEDIFRTGAKCVAGDLQDLKGDGANYHITGALRTKPGRGDPTCSMSCSDKMAVWNICGLQGALASHFLAEPIYWSSIVIGKCPFNQSSLQRAIIDRTSDIAELPESYLKSQPRFFQSNFMFEYSKENLEKMCTTAVPCPAAIIWSDIPKQEVEVCVNGKKQGITKKNLGKSSSWVNVCRRKLAAEFILIVSLIPVNELPSDLRHYLKQNGSYLNFKEAAINYQKAKSAVFTIFKEWTKKPAGLQDFNPKKQLM